MRRPLDAPSASITLYPCSVSTSAINMRIVGSSSITSTVSPAGGALFPYLECMVNQSFGMVIGKGGADTIVNAMTSALKKRNAALILGAPVTSIDVSSGRAAGVTLADGHRLKLLAL